MELLGERQREGGWRDRGTTWDSEGIWSDPRSVVMGEDGSTLRVGEGPNLDPS